MGHTLEQFTSQCHQFLKNNPGPAGRQQVANLLKDVLLDKEFIEKYLHANVGEREIIYKIQNLVSVSLRITTPVQKIQPRMITRTLGRFTVRHVAKQRCVITN